VTEDVAHYLRRRPTLDLPTSVRVTQNVGTQERRLQPRGRCVLDETVAYRGRRGQAGYGICRETKISRAIACGGRS
jgi:hypothetical protein